MVKKCKINYRPAVIAATAIFLCLLAKYASVILIPLAISLAVSRIGIAFSEKTGIKTVWLKKAISIFVSLFIYSSIFFFIAVLWKRIYFQAAEICREIISDTDKISALRKIIAEKIFRASGEGLYDMFYSALKSAAVNTAAALPSIAAKIAAAVPKIFLSVIVTVLLGIYLCLDGDAVFSFIAGHIRHGAKLLFTTVKAYGIIFLLTFAELFFGFSIMKVRFSAVVALAVAIVDILPVLGTGAVLLPWAAVKLALGERPLALGLFILWAVITLIRQIVEPKLIGDGLGIPPVLSLLAMYAGYCLFGACGAIIFPFAAAICFTDIKAENHNAIA